MSNNLKTLKFLLFGGTCAALLACSASDGPRSADDIAALPVLPLRVTSDIITPETMTKAGFIPKAVQTEGSNFTLNLPGQIVTLADTGSLWFTTTEGEEPLLVSVGPYADFHPVPQSNGDSLVIAVKEDGAVSTFIQPNGSDRFESLPVSSNEATIRSFCAGHNLDVMHLVTHSGDLRNFSVTLARDNQVAEITVNDTIKTSDNVLSCYTDQDGIVYAETQGKNSGIWSVISDGKSKPVVEAANMTNVAPLKANIFAGLDAATGTPLITLPSGSYRANIEDGLSIQGLETTEFMAYTPASMGTVYSDGLFVLSDPNENRLVLMSAGFVNKALDEVSER